MNSNIRTLIAVAVIDSTDSTILDVAKLPRRVREDVAALADVFVVLDTDGIATASAKISYALIHEAEDGTVSGTTFRLNSKVSPVNVAGLDFSAIIGGSPNPVRLLEIDVDGKGRLVGAEVLSATTIKAATAALIPADKHLCGAPAFYGPCRLPVASADDHCPAHSAATCGADTTYGSACRMPVAKTGDNCLLHGGPAKKARGRKAA